MRVFGLEIRFGDRASDVTVTLRQDADGTVKFLERV